MTEFSDHLIRLRRSRGWSQEQLAELVGVTRQAVSKWEAGRSTPDLDRLLALSDLFGLTLDQLVRGEGRPDAPCQPAIPGQTADPTAGGPTVILVAPREGFEYRSRRTLFGLPLLHVNLGRGLRVARGVFAVGNIALGFFSAGAFSAGLFSFGALSLGLLLAVGALSVGAVAVGALSLGAVAFGAAACGSYAAAGAAAISGRVAVGAAARAPVAVGIEPSGLHTLCSDAPGFGREAAARFILQWQPGTPRALVWLLTFFLP